MQRLGAILVVAAIAVLSFGCTTKPPVFVPSKVALHFPMTVRKALEDPLRFTFLTLDPSNLRDKERAALAAHEADNPLKRKIFHGYRVLGQSTPNKSEVGEIVNALYQAYAEKTDNLRASCFNPRHGIIAERDGEKVELVICFECHWMRVLVNGERTGSRLIAPSSAKEFNRIANELGMALPTK